jgi:hypothetical protein
VAGRIAFISVAAFYAGNRDELCKRSCAAGLMEDIFLTLTANGK